MKIREQTSDFLILEEFPFIMGSVYGILALAGLVFSLVSFSNQDYEKFYAGLFGFAFFFSSLLCFLKKAGLSFVVQQQGWSGAEGDYFPQKDGLFHSVILKMLFFGQMVAKAMVLTIQCFLLRQEERCLITCTAQTKKRYV